MSRVFVQFGLGPIGAGLFVRRALRSGAFDRVVVVEAAAALLEFIRRAAGSYELNIADRDGRHAERLGPIEIYRIDDAADLGHVQEALADASEIAVALPSVDYYERGNPSVAELLARAVHLKAVDERRPNSYVYCAENDRLAAERLADAVRRRCRTPAPERLEFLNTVIGKMSRVVDGEEMATLHLRPIAPGLERAFLVEAFDAIFVQRPRRLTHARMLGFIEKEDLEPFEEAKLYGHNAVHAYLGFMGARSGLHRVAEACAHPEIGPAARAALWEESGRALVAKFRGADPLFTDAGWQEYATDLWQRMASPHLADTIERTIRDPLRKLRWNDRLVGTIRLALSQGIQPVHYPGAVLAATAAMGIREFGDLRRVLFDLWAVDHPDMNELAAVWSVLQEAAGRLTT